MFRRLLDVLIILTGAVTPGIAQLVELPARPCVPACPPDAACVSVALCRPGAARVIRTSSRVRADLDGRVVRYEVSETYVNRGGSVGQADYLLPLPKGAAFEDLALSINGEMVTGETMEIETKYLRLRQAVILGHRIDDWRVCWLGGWEKWIPLDFRTEPSAQTGSRASFRSSDWLLPSLPLRASRSRLARTHRN